MNNDYLRYMSRKPVTIFVTYILFVGSMTTMSCIIAPYSYSLKLLAFLSVGLFLGGLIGLIRDYRKAKRMEPWFTPGNEA